MDALQARDQFNLIEIQDALGNGQRKSRRDERNKPKMDRVLQGSDKWEKVLSSLARLGFILVGWCYVVGLLILNLHLGQYGVFSLNLLQVEYVMAGALWTFLVGFTYCLLHFVALPLRSGHNEGEQPPKRVGSAIRILTMGGLALSALVFVLFVLSDSELGLSQGSKILPTLAVGGILVLTAMTFVQLTSDIQVIVQRAFLGQASKKIDGVAKQASLSIFGFPIIVLLLLLSIYALYAFPKFSPAIGGGQKQVVEFISKADQRETIINLGFPVLHGSQRFGPVEVIFETSDFLTLSPPKEFSSEGKAKAIRIRKDLIEAVIYLGRPGAPQLRPLS